MSLFHKRHMQFLTSAPNIRGSSDPPLTWPSWTPAQGGVWSQTTTPFSPKKRKRIIGEWWCLFSHE